MRSNGASSSEPPNFRAKSSSANAPRKRPSSPRQISAASSKNSIEGIFQTSTGGHYLSANRALSRIYGYESPQQLIHAVANIGGQLYVNSERRAEFVRQIQEADEVSNFESQIYRKDGTIIWISENARVVRDAAGRVLYYEGTVVDVTARKLAEQALRTHP